MINTNPIETNVNYNSQTFDILWDLVAKMEWKGQNFYYLQE